MPRLVDATPVLASLDIARSVAFYVEKLGFTKVLNHEDEYGIVARDGIEIHLWKCDDQGIPRNTSCRINVEDIDDLHAELEPRGVIHPNGRLEDKPWGLREFPVLDGDGNLITFAAAKTKPRREGEPGELESPIPPDDLDDDFLGSWKQLNPRPPSASED